MMTILKILAGAVVHVTEAYTNQKVVSGTLSMGEGGVKVSRDKVDVDKIVEIRIRRGESPEIYIETKNSLRLIEEGEGKIS